MSCLPSIDQICFRCWFFKFEVDQSPSFKWYWQWPEPEYDTWTPCLITWCNVHTIPLLYILVSVCSVQNLIDCIHVSKQSLLIYLCIYQWIDEICLTKLTHNRVNSSMSSFMYARLVWPSDESLFSGTSWCFTNALLSELQLQAATWC